MTKQGNLFPRGGDHSRVCINFCFLLFLELVASFALNMSFYPHQVSETSNKFASNMLQRQRLFQFRRIWLGSLPSCL